MDEQSVLDITTHDGPIATTTSDCPAYADLGMDSIRLLRILPGDPTSEVCCEITQFSLHEQPKYTALSYVWGSETADCIIKLNGHRFHVRKNLWRFLHQARGLGPTLFGLFWIDAVCINQAHNAERTHQVNLMSEIYRTAESVLVWLGPQYGDSDKAMRALAQPVSYWRAKRRFSEVWAKPTGTAICGLCVRPYWKRLWVFQELMLAENIDMMCGSDIVRWDLFRAFLLEVYISTPVPRAGDRVEHDIFQTSAAIPMVRNSSRQPGQVPLWDLMFEMQHLRCIEMRDKVYALLGVAVAGHTSIEPDYTTPIPTLLNSVLGNQHKLQRPESIEEVEAQCQQIARLLGIEAGSMFSLGGQEGRFPPPRDADIAAFPFGRQGSHITLWWASFYGHSVVEELLFQDGTVCGNTSLLSSASDGNEAAVNLLVSTGKVDVNSKEDSTGRTSLWFAAANAEESIVKIMLNISNIDVNSRDSQNGRTPIWWAARNGLEAILKMLLDKDEADVNAKEYGSGRTPILIATMCGHERAVEVLLSTDDVDVDLGDIRGRTPIGEAMARGHVAIVKMLLDTGKVGAEYRWDVLCWAVEGGYAGVTKALFHTGYVDLRTEDGWTVLHCAAWEGKEGIVKSLLDTGKINVEWKDNARQTSLSLAVQRGQEAVAKLLLENGKANANSTDNRGRTVLHWAARDGNKAIVKLLLDTGKAKVELKDERGETALSLAVQRGQEAAAKLLLENGKANANSTDNRGRTVLHWAARDGNEAMVKLLLDRGRIDVEAKDNAGDTALQLAIDSGREAAETMLRRAAQL